MNILVVAAHPDDEVLGCGGTIAKHSSAGHSVTILILGEGITSRFSDPQQADKKSIDALHANANAVGKFLGAKEVILAKFSDNRFDTVPLLDIVKVVEEQIERVRPTIVYTQHGGDLNIDHVCTFRAVLTATRPMEGAPVKKVLAYRVGSSSEWAFEQFAPVFHAQIFEDISQTIEKKVQAMQMYESEARAFPHPRSAEALRATATYWGSVSGLRAAEPFSLVRELL